MVLPEADWQRMKGQLIYEGWAAKAAARRPLWLQSSRAAHHVDSY